jgi:hypothetical protein
MEEKLHRVTAPLDLKKTRKDARIKIYEYYQVISNHGKGLGLDVR